MFKIILGRKQSRHVFDQPSSIWSWTSLQHRRTDRPPDTRQKARLWTAKRRSRNRRRRPWRRRCVSRDERVHHGSGVGYRLPRRAGQLRRNIGWEFQRIHRVADHPAADFRFRRQRIRARVRVPVLFCQGVRIGRARKFCFESEGVGQGWRRKRKNRLFAQIQWRGWDHWTPNRPKHVFLIKVANPCLFSFIFGLFQPNKTIFTTNQSGKKFMSILYTALGFEPMTLYFFL